MTQKHFIALADMMKKVEERRKEAGPTALINTCGSAMYDVILHELAVFCEEQNPTFNSKLWYDYIAGICGPNGGKV